MKYLSFLILFLSALLLSGCGTSPANRGSTTLLPGTPYGETGMVTAGQDTQQMSQVTHTIDTLMASEKQILANSAPNILTLATQTEDTLSGLASTGISVPTIKEIIVVQQKPIAEYQKLIQPYKQTIETIRRQTPNIKISQIDTIPKDTRAKIGQYEEVFVKSFPEQATNGTSPDQVPTVNNPTPQKSVDVLPVINAIALTTPDIPTLAANIQAVDPYTLDNGAIVSKEFKQNFEQFKQNFDNSPNSLPIFHDDTFMLQTYIMMIDDAKARAQGDCGAIGNEMSRSYCEFQKTHTNP